MKKYLLLVFIILAQISINAYSKSSGPFYFAGGTVSPKSTLSISLRKLLPIEDDVPIVITCDIENSNYNKPYPAVLKLSTYKVDSNICSLNGVTSPTKLYLLNNKVSKYQVRTTNTYWETLNFQNYDDTDTVFITNCKAVYGTATMGVRRDASDIAAGLSHSSNHVCAPKIRGQCADLCRKDGYKSGYCKGSIHSTGVCICS